MPLKKVFCKIFHKLYMAGHELFFRMFKFLNDITDLLQNKNPSDLCIEKNKINHSWR